MRPLVTHTAWNMAFSFLVSKQKDQYKARLKRNRAFLYWLKQNVYCRVCGATEDLEFHHEYERRNGGRTLPEKAGKTPGMVMDELMKGFFLCEKCHREWHLKEFGEPPTS